MKKWIRSEGNDKLISKALKENGKESAEAKSEKTLPPPEFEFRFDFNQSQF